jgi:hypothetical protein
MKPIAAATAIGRVKCLNRAGQIEQMNPWRYDENDSSFGRIQHKNNIPLLQYSNTPLLRPTEFEDEDDDEDENEEPRDEKPMSLTSTIPKPPS